jgi:hypothetical protein
MVLGNIRSSLAISDEFKEPKPTIPRESVSPTTDAKGTHSEKVVIQDLRTACSGGAGPVESILGGLDPQGLLE